MKPILTSQAPRPAGHYSQGIEHAGLVFVAGQLAIDPDTGSIVGEDDADAQTVRALRNVQAILEAGGSGLHRLLSVTIYITGHELWGPVNQAFARVMGDHRPARAIVPVPGLRPGCLVEIQAVAARAE
ncbi:MAG TPA: RidA family protein [Gemmatimonadaceae bacterium]|nr:RidA family protein [Gemmatimonadaceae bacterium]